LDLNFTDKRQAVMKSGIPKTNRYTTIPNHSGDMPEGTLRAILKQADITPDDFVNYK
jgi:hypothetical protein